MKKALHISLGQSLFAVEDDAYAKLDDYLRSVRAHFAETDGSDEIIADIEGRIAEQFLASKKNVITMDEVNAVIRSMGHIEDFGDEQAKAGTTSAADSTAPRERKFYRNPDDAIIAGVCSGIAAYLNVEVLWVRLAFVLFTLGTGFGIILYILFWFLVPEANTPSQKLEMTGNPVTLATLSENVKEKIDEVKSRNGSTLRNVIAFPFEVLRKIVAFVAHVIFPLIRVLVGAAFAFISLMMILALTFALGVFLTGSPERLADFPILDVISHVVAYTVVFGGYLVLAIPALFIFLLAASVISKRSLIRSNVGLGLAGVWAIALVFTGVAAFKGGLAYQDYVNTSPQYQEVSKNIPFDGKVTALDASFGQSVTLVQGDTPSIVVTGREKDINTVMVSVKDGTLMLDRKQDKRICIFCDTATPTVVVTTPTLASITVANGSRLETTAWKSTVPMALAFSFGSWGTLVLDAPSINAEASNGSGVTLRGNTSSSTLTAMFGGQVLADELVSKQSTVKSENGGWITVNASDTLDATARLGGEVRYAGNPKLTKHTSIGGEVIPADAGEDQ